jgi:hypothetical protein
MPFNFKIQALAALLLLLPLSSCVTTSADPWAQNPDQTLYSKARSRQSLKDAYLQSPLPDDGFGKIREILREHYLFIRSQIDSHQAYSKRLENEHNISFMNSLLGVGNASVPMLDNLALATKQAQATCAKLDAAGQDAWAATLAKLEALRLDGAAEAQRAKLALFFKTEPEEKRPCALLAAYFSKHAALNERAIRALMRSYSSQDTRWASMRSINYEMQRHREEYEAKGAPIQGHPDLLKQVEALRRRSFRNQPTPFDALDLLR